MLEVTTKVQNLILQFEVLGWCKGGRNRAKTVNNAKSIFQFTHIMADFKKIVKKEEEKKFLQRFQFHKL